MVIMPKEEVVPVNPMHDFAVTEKDLLTDTATTPVEEPAYTEQLAPETSAEIIPAALPVRKASAAKSKWQNRWNWK